MKTNVIKILKWMFSVGIVTLLLESCIYTDQNSGTLNEVQKYPKELWGEWIRMDTGATWYIGSNYITGSPPSDITLLRQSENVIEVTTDVGQKYYLYASRTANASFTGRIVGIEQTNRSVQRTVQNGKGWIGVVVEDLHSGDKSATSTDGDGNFEVVDAIPGDDYLITPEGGEGVIVTPIVDGDDVGTITVTSGLNFKTTIRARYSSVDMARLFANGNNYDFTIEVANTGSIDCTAALCTLEFPDGLTAISVPESRILGTIEPDRKKTIDITVACSAIAEEYEFKKIGVTIDDPLSGNTWQDSVSLRFHRATVDFNIRAGRGVSGIIITPTGGTYSFTNTTSATVTVPWSPKDFLVVFSGASADTETVYSLGIGVIPDTNFNYFVDVANYEPNDTENTATRLEARDKIMSYLHKNDIDYYRITL